MSNILYTNEAVFGPNQRGSVCWVSYRKAKACRFDFHSGHMSGFQVQSLVGAHVKGNQ